MKCRFLSGLVVLVLISEYVCAADRWKRLRIGLGHYENEEPLSPQLTKALYLAIDNIQNIVMVNVGIQETTVSHKHLAKCSKRSDKPKAIDFVITNKFVMSKPNAKNSFVLEEEQMNFLLLLLTSKETRTDSNIMLATASSCFYAQQQKPILGKLTVYTRNYAWKTFDAAYDLFRHELLHALGFGVILPSNSIQLKDSRIWRDGRSRKQTISVFGMDFSHRALVYARKHFKCSNLKLVEAENMDRNHLSEYVFGNELMTPLLNNGKNHLTMLSALILEDTFTGERQWYKTNSSLVQKETEMYWYGRSWGCTFTSNSCTDYIEDQLKKKRSSFPFCTQYDYGRRPKKICANIEPKNKEILMHCNAHGHHNFHGYSHGLTPISLRDYFPRLNMRYSYRYGSSQHFRFCPFAENVLNGQIEVERKDSTFTDC